MEFFPEPFSTFEKAKFVKNISLLLYKILKNLILQRTMDYTRLVIRIKVFWKFIKDYFVNAKFDVGKYLHASSFKQLNSFTLNIKGNQFSKWH